MFHNLTDTGLSQKTALELALQPRNDKCRILLTLWMKLWNLGWWLFSLCSVSCNETSRFMLSVKRVPRTLLIGSCSAFHITPSEGTRELNILVLRGHYLRLTPSDRCVNAVARNIWSRDLNFAHYYAQSCLTHRLASTKDMSSSLSHSFPSFSALLFTYLQFLCYSP